MSTTGKYVIDSWAWIEYLLGSEAGSVVKDTLEKKEVFTNVVTMAEVASKFQREGLNPNEAYAAITSKSKIIDIDVNFAYEVGVLHAKTKKSSPNFSLADAFVLHSAISKQAKVLTGDSDFKGIKEAEML